MAKVLSVSKNAEHRFSKAQVPTIHLIAGEGVDGDAHRGAMVKHIHLAKKDAESPNLRQVHLIHNELLEELRGKGFNVSPGVIGENITTSGLDLLSLPVGTVLKFGATARIELTGLRSPCSQLDKYQKGLVAAVLDRDEQGNLIRKSGVMAIVLDGGPVSVDDAIAVSLPPEPYLPLVPV
ncbi:MOSC domain-containing protein [Hahella aquimaris]|uniref:MOSC domain-containing protein n=1 Tax=Hahella sp. HNIBRBA332 TaxID=3015983 RepID=UPI00273BEF2D|nr:MOSC domain-containing protein [Hahella sp. HNIBRBA332]WLQ11350.1 MOSC domain-containing protein [Hahella sp. HNIBRBA332]